MSNSTPEDLFQQVKNDDPNALKELFRQFHGPMCLVSCRLIKDRDVAKDIVQDVFVKLWSNRKDVGIKTSFAGYLRRSVVNATLNRIESKNRFPTLRLDTLGEKDIAQSHDGDLDKKEIEKEIEAAIDRLPDRTRAVFILVRQEEMSYRKVSEALDISEKAVEKEMMRALRLLREMLRHWLAVLLLAGVMM